MLWITMLFFCFIWFIATAPKEAVQMALSLGWAVLAVGCTVSVASSLL